MTAASLWKKYHTNDALVAVTLAVALITSMTAFENIAGVPASIRGTAVYNSMTLPNTDKGHNSAEEVDETFKDRLCDRVVKHFANDQTMWTRVNQRILKRFGFDC